MPRKQLHTTYRESERSNRAILTSERSASVWPAGWRANNGVDVRLEQAYKAEVSSKRGSRSHQNQGTRGLNYMRKRCIPGVQVGEKLRPGGVGTEGVGQAGQVEIYL